MAENVALPPFSLPFAGIGAHVVFSDLAVVKYQNVARTRLEFKKTELAAEVGRSTGSFWVPPVLAHDVASGSITFERIYGFSSLNVALSTLPRADRLIEKVARALAAIHDRLRLPDDYRVALPTFGLALQSPPVFVHGDFSTANILYRPQDDRLAIIDWSPSDWLAGGVGTLGPRYADMTILLQSLFTSRPFGPHPIRERDKLGRAFLDVYGEHTNGEVRLDEFGEYSEALLDLFLAQRRKQMGLRFLAYQPSFRRLRHFIRKFCLQGRSR